MPSPPKAVELLVRWYSTYITKKLADSSMHILIRRSCKACFLFLIDTTAATRNTAVSPLTAAYIGGRNDRSYPSTFGIPNKTATTTGITMESTMINLLYGVCV